MKLSDIIDRYEWRQEFPKNGCIQYKYCVTKAKIPGVCKPGEIFAYIIFLTEFEELCFRSDTKGTKSIKFYEKDVDLHLDKWKSSDQPKTTYDKWADDKLPLP